MNQLDSLCHFGIKGMHWGVRRFQNKDGSLTEEGFERYNRNIEKTNDKKKKAAKYRLKAAKNDYKRTINEINGDELKASEYKIKAQKFLSKSKYLDLQVSKLENYNYKLLS